jgi:hypothetical protein
MSRLPMSIKFRVSSSCLMTPSPSEIFALLLRRLSQVLLIIYQLLLRTSTEYSCSLKRSQARPHILETVGSSVPRCTHQSCTPQSARYRATSHPSHSHLMLITAPSLQVTAGDTRNPQERTAVPCTIAQSSRRFKTGL